MLIRYREILQLLLKSKSKKDVTMWNVNELKHQGLVIVVFHHHTIISNGIREYYKRVCD